MKATGTNAAPAVQATAPQPSNRARIEPLPDNAPHILVVDDDHKIRDLLGRFLLSSGFRVTQAADAAAARAFMRGLTFDLVLLDVMMPGEVRLEPRARSEGDAAGADLHADRARRTRKIASRGWRPASTIICTKPFEPRELLLRAQEHPAPRPGAAASTTRRDPHGRLAFHIARGELQRDDESIKLTERERDLLRLFANRIGLPVPRHELASDESTGSERAIDVQINRLRRKIESDPSNPGLSADRARQGLRPLHRLNPALPR